LIEAELPKVELRLPEPGAELSLDCLFNPPPEALWLEIGFGGGEHLAAQAEANPRVGFIGAEVFVNGIAGLLRQARERGLDNIRVLTEDARPLLARLPEGSLGRVFLLFPDPWPKRRHHKRRFVQPETLDALARAMAPGAEFRVATDDAGYLRWILRHLLADPRFEWTAQRAADWRERPEDWPPTRYEGKAIAQGRRPTYLTFVRRARSAHETP
jgi:tRNA (guanine-N7-)-methyltransferase